MKNEGYVSAFEAHEKMKSERFAAMAPSDSEQFGVAMPKQTTVQLNADEAMLLLLYRSIPEQWQRWALERFKDTAKVAKGMDVESHDRPPKT